MPLERYFFALQPHAAALPELARIPVPPGSVAVHPADLHLTLRFLGSLGAHDEPTVVAAVAVALRDRAATGRVPVLLDRLAAWPGPRVLCATGPSDGTLGRLAAATGEGIATLGFPPESRSFRSHVTLARKLSVPPPPAAAVSPGIAWEAREIVLMASEAGAAPPRYRVRARIPLSGA